jgi:syntaxin-binding protein 1
VDVIDKPRDRQPNYDALYIVRPTRYNVDVIMQDFNPQNRRYSAAHMFFLSTMDQRLIDKISNSPMRPLIRSLVELNLDFNPIERAVFSTGSPDTFQILYNDSCRPLRDNELTLISKKVEISRVGLIIACLVMCFLGRKSCDSIL